jgi:WD40 repeat protein
VPRDITAEAGVTSVSFLNDGSLAGDCDDGQVRVWDPSSGVLRRLVKREKSDGGAAFADRGQMVTLTPRGAKVWDLADGLVKRQQAGAAGTHLRDAAISPDRAWLAAASRLPDSIEDAVYVFDSAGKVRFSAPAGLGGVSEMAVSPDGSAVAVASYDTDVRVWDTSNGELRRRIEELPVAVFAMRYSPDGRWLAAAGADRLIHVFDAKTLRRVRSLRGQNEMISSMAFSPDSRRVLTGGFSERTARQAVEVLLWDFDSGTVLRRYPAARQVRSVALSASMGAAAAGEKKVYLFEGS